MYGMYAPSLLVQGRNKVIVVGSNLAVLLLALVSFVLGGPADGIEVERPHVVRIAGPVREVAMQPVLGIVCGHMGRHDEFVRVLIGMEVNSNEREFPQLGKVGGRN